MNQEEVAETADNPRIRPTGEVRMSGLRPRAQAPVVAAIDLRVEVSTVRQLALGGGGGRHKTDANTQKRARRLAPAGRFAKPKM